MTEEPIKVFFSYSHEDEKLKDELIKHLSILQRQGTVSVWNDRLIPPGSEWDQEIDDQLNSADIILLLVSPDFLASDYCWGIEVKRAMQRHEAGEACVIPVLLRHVDWKDAPFAKLQVLPDPKKPIKGRRDRDKAFCEVTKGITTAVENLRKVQKQRRNAEQQVLGRVKLQARERKRQEEEWLMRQQQAEEIIARRSLHSLEKLKYFLLMLLIGGACGIIWIAFPLTSKLLQLPNQSEQSSSQTTAEDFFKRGSEKNEIGDKQGAIADYDQAIKLKPDTAEAYYNRGLIHKERGENQSAIADFQRAADLYQQQDNSVMYRSVLEHLKELQP